MDPIRWPNGKKFAFTVFDDTDNVDHDNVRGVYDFLSELGFHTTKSVWMFEPTEEPRIGGLTLADGRYREYVQELQRRGFEIGFHGASSVSSPRERTIAALDEFRRIFGHYPFSHANHAGNREGIHFGIDRFTGWRRPVYKKLKGGMAEAFEGHVAGSPYFWGDVCRERIQYVRNWVFNGLNTLALCPEMPYRDPRTPYVNEWFCSSNCAGSAGIEHWRDFR